MLVGIGIDHAGPGERRDRVGAHVEALHVERDRFRQADDAELGGGVVGLAEIADQARGRGHMHVGARSLRLEVRRGGAADVERTLEMHASTEFELLLGHLMEQAVAQIAGVVDHGVDAAERVDRRLHDPLRALPGGDAVAVGDGAAAERLDLVDDLVGDCAFALAGRG